MSSFVLGRRARCYTAPMILLPHLRLERVEQLQPPVLREHGLRALLLDLDETLLAAAATTPDASVRAWADELRGAGIPMAIVSNGTRERVRAVAASLGIAGTPLAGKPRPSAYRRALDPLGVAVGDSAMVGDQLFTDVVGARLAGLRTVLVEPRSEGGLPHTRVLRRIERRVLRGGTRGRSIHR